MIRLQILATCSHILKRNYRFIIACDGNPFDVEITHGDDSKTFGITKGRVTFLVEDVRTDLCFGILLMNSAMTRSRTVAEESILGALGTK